MRHTPTTSTSSEGVLAQKLVELQRQINQLEQTRVRPNSMFYSGTLVTTTGEATVMPNKSFVTRGGECWAFFTGTGYATNPGAFAFYLYVDGAFTEQSFMWLNSTLVHTSFPGMWVKLGALTAKAHTFALVSSTALVTDNNDRGQILVVEYP